jgi:hypothetical protein
MALTKVSTGMLSADVASIDLNIDANTMYIDVSNNRVGINNAAPSTALDVTGSVTADGLTVETSTDPASITLRHTGNTSGFLIKNFSGGEAQLVNVDNGPMVFKTNDTERMRITSAGQTQVVGYDAMTLGFPAVAGGASRSGIKPTVTGAGAGQLQFLVGGDNTTEATTIAATLDASGNLGIGTSSPSRELEVTGTGNVYIKATAQGTTDSAGLELDNAGVVWLIQNDDTSSDALTFDRAGVEAMRLDTNGNLLVGTTTSGNSRLRVAGSAVSQPLVQLVSEDAGDLSNPALYLIKKDNNNTTAQTFVRFVMNGGSTANGQINGNGAGAAAFGSWSDRRLKENIEDLPSQLDNITSLRPVEFDYIESEGGGHQLGFIAQEVEEIYPDLVGERPDGMKTLSGMGKMEARLIKAIQEQQAIIDSLTARIAALES